MLGSRIYDIAKRHPKGLYYANVIYHCVLVTLIQETFRSLSSRIFFVEILSLQVESFKLKHISLNGME